MAAQPERMSGRRKAVVWTLFGLATLLLLVSSLTVWTKRQFLNTDAWTQSSAKLLANDQIRSALSVKLSNALYENVDVTDAVRQRLPEQARAAAPVIAAALQNGSGRAIDTFLATPAAQNLWEELNRRMHATLVSVLEGKDVGALETANGDIVLNLQPMVKTLAQRLGFADQLAEHARPGAGQIVILRSDQLANAQHAVKVLRALSIFLLLVVLLFYALAIYLARGRRRAMLEYTGAALVVVGLLLLIARRLLGNAIIESIVSTTSSRPAANAAWLIATDMLRDIALGLIVYGLLFLVGGILAGPSRAATWVRREVAPVFAHGWVVVYGIGLAIFLLLIAFGPEAGGRRLIGVLVLAALFFSGLEVYRRITLREFPQGEAAETPPAEAEQSAPVLGN